MMVEALDIDVLIVGAGINGAGLFRDLCEQGLSCAIVDKGDYGSGTSAAPSRLIHGGLKYLETGELRLVAQSTLERNLLLRNAAHAVTALPTIVPIFSWLGGIPAAIRTLFGSTTAPRSRGALLIKIGLALYDFYGSRARVMPRHAMWSKSRALREVPPLTPRIVAAGTYYDAKVAMPERLVLELVLDGLAANPAGVALNHVTLQGQRDGVVSLTGADGADVAFRPRIVVNASGPWIDKVNASLGAPSRLIGGTKGSHIVLDHSELIAALKGRMIYFEADDGRICLVYDYLGKVLVGSTDLVADDPDDVSCTEPEIAYFFEALRSLLPGLSFSADQIVYSYAGIRPLPASDSTAPGLISRDHSAPQIEAVAGRPFRILSMVGGKWTTFRGFAEEVADEVLTTLGSPRRKSTRALPIGGGRGFPRSPEARKRWIEEQHGMTGAPLERCSALLDRYGSRASAVLAHEAENGATARTELAGYTGSELDWLVRNEHVVHLDDLVLRRTSLAITGRLVPRDLERMARIAARALNWDEARLQAELSDTRALLGRRHMSPAFA